MIDIESIADLELLRESVDLECKLAAGRDGKGALPDDFFGPPARISVPSSSNLPGSSSNLPGSSSNLPGSSSNLPGSSSNLPGSSSNLAGKRDADGCLISEQLALPVVDNLSALSQRLRKTLEAAAAEPRWKGKVDREVLIEVVLQLCTGRFVTLRCLAELVHRKPATLRNQYLSRLVRDRKLTLAFPTTPTHERQAYVATSSMPA